MTSQTELERSTHEVTRRALCHDEHLLLLKHDPCHALAQRSTSGR